MTSEELGAYLAALLTRRLGEPERTPDGKPVWPCRYFGEHALATICRRLPGHTPVLHIQQSPDGAPIEVSAVRMLPIDTRDEADLAVALLECESKT